ncbi:MAG: hypothetical protein BWY11_01030 [Firmicutes bacterium ADurb.Bin182]|nr:MAG: hypothetical protein BWY11_01030 [Firmicutes bacterium ADurb.Bin182]
MNTFREGPGANAGKIALVIDKGRNDYCGTACSYYFHTCVRFLSLHEMLFALEDLFDTLRFPEQTMKYRVFKQKTPRIIKARQAYPMDDIEKLTKNTEKTTFIINVLYRQNASWQGSIHWVNQNQTMNFRSTNELIKLMDSALSCEDETVEWDIRGKNIKSEEISKI